MSFPTIFGEKIEKSIQMQVDPKANLLRKNSDKNSTGNQITLPKVGWKPPPLIMGLMGRKSSGKSKKKLI